MSPTLPEDFFKFYSNILLLQDHLQNDLVTALESSSNGVLKAAWQNRNVRSSFEQRGGGGSGSHKRGSSSASSSHKRGSSSTANPIGDGGDSSSPVKKKKKEKAGKKMTGAKTVSVTFRGQMQVSVLCVLQDSAVLFLSLLPSSLSLSNYYDRSLYNYTYLDNH